MIRHVAGAENPRELVVVAVTAIATVGTALCLLTVHLLGPYLPTALHFQQRGKMTLLLTALVVFTALSGTLDAGLVAIRSSHSVLIKNVLGSIVRVAGLFFLVRFGAAGLLVSYCLGLILASVLGSVALGRGTKGRVRLESIGVLWRYLAVTPGRFLGHDYGNTSPQYCTNRGSDNSRR